MSKKTNQETLRPVDKYSDRDPKDSASHEVMAEETWKRAGQEDVEAEDTEPADMTGKAYQVLTAAHVAANHVKWGS